MIATAGASLLEVHRRGFTVELLQQLEGRLVFAGGVDASFRSAAGAVFESPNSGFVVNDTAVDRYGRVFVVGHADSGRDGFTEAIMGRLGTEGRRDTTFSTFGAFNGTPRGMVEFKQVLALREGGYVMSGSTSDHQHRLIAFDSRGRINTSFGRNGVAILGDVQVTQLLQQPDGKIVAVGSGLTPDFVSNGFSESRNFIVRFLADGRLDRDYGNAGWVDVGVAGFLEDSDLTNNVITSASLDPSGRLLLSIRNHFTTLDDADNNPHSTSTILLRFGGKGEPDPRFVGRRIHRDSSERGTAGLDVLPAISVTRSDGQIVALSRLRGESNAVLDLTLRGANAQIPPDRVVHSGIITNGLFVVPTLADGVIAAVEDNKIVVAGALLEGSVTTPVLVRFDENLQHDLTFGTNGILRLPNTGGAVEATEVMHNPDGTLTAVLAAPPEASARADDPTIVRVFQDDRPVVAFRGATRKGSQIRVTTSIRGINPIDGASIDSKDIYLVDEAGGRAKARMLGFLQRNNGDYSATYSFARSAGTFSVVSVGGQVEDDLANRQRTIATITI